MINLKKEKENAPEICSKEQGYILRGASASELWPRILDTIIKFGKTKDGEYKIKQE